uniref:Glabrous enhancer-binding protein-like DBD domain-containing protein n=1 Tax=Medicago truncatula TaxID=3880 RepID=I3T5F7_MEDTR|nr:unknown [Medicago truncatula]
MKTQTQAQAQSTPVPIKSGTKRVAESSTGNDSKRSKKKTTTAGGGSDDENEVEEDAKLTGEDSKKNFQRVFSEEDELVILKGLGDFVAKTGKDPMKETAAFHSFVKKLLKADANAEQLKRKVRGLKKKFESSDNFTKPHDKRAFDLFKVWSKNASKEAEENGKSNEKIAKSAKKEAPVKNGGSAKKN